MTVRKLIEDITGLDVKTEVIVRDYLKEERGKWYGTWLEKFYSREIYGYIHYVQNNRLVIELAGEWNA